MVKTRLIPFMGSILVTGANGFVGHALCSELVRKGIPVRAVVRSNARFSLGDCERVGISSISATTDWTNALSGVETVIHLAARVHVMQDYSSNPIDEFRKVNVAGTEHLARAAVQKGVKRFIFLSSAKVNGEFTLPGRAFSEIDVPSPEDAYAVSKHEAELSLRRLAEKSGMEVVIIRPPLVYGPGVKANFLTMMNWLNKGMPLPLGLIDNRRSFVAIDNLVNFVITCVDHPQAADQTFLVADGEDFSTAQLLRRMGYALGKPARLIPVPLSILSAGAFLFGKRDLSQRLLGNFQVDTSKAKELLGWSPMVSAEEAFKATAKHYLVNL